MHAATLNKEGMHWKGEEHRRKQGEGRTILEEKRRSRKENWELRTEGQDRNEGSRDEELAESPSFVEVA